MAIEIVDFPNKNGDFPWQNVSSPEGNFKHGWLFEIVSWMEVCMILVEQSSTNQDFLGFPLPRYRTCLRITRATRLLRPQKEKWALCCVYRRHWVEFFIVFFPYPTLSSRARDVNICLLLFIIVYHVSRCFMFALKLRCKSYIYIWFLYTFVFCVGYSWGLSWSFVGCYMPSNETVSQQFAPVQETAHSLRRAAKWHSLLM